MAHAHGLPALITLVFCSVNSYLMQARCRFYHAVNAMRHAILSVAACLSSLLHIYVYDPKQANDVASKQNTR